MTDTPEKPRKKLTLKKSPAAETAAPAAKTAEPRKRAGARARQVAQLERTREQQAPRDAPDADASDSPRPPARPASRTPRPTHLTSRSAHTAFRPEEPASRSEHRDSRSRDHSSSRSTNSARSEFHSENNRARPANTESRPGNEPGRTRPTGDDRSDARSSRRLGAMAGPEIFPIFAPCPQGLEEALTAEMQALGFDDAAPGRAGCRFHSDWTGVQRANLYSRLATRILVQVAQGPADHEDDILDLAYDTPWERWFGAEQTLRVDTSAIRSPMQSLQYCNLRAKDGICDRLLDREGERPDIDTVRPDARVHLFLDEDSATLYLDTSGESLFKRGWRLDKGEAPLRENLAAGILALAGWDPSQALLDPFCGSGTILIEAAWIALGVPPGIARPFSFERLRGHDVRHWRDVKDDARAHIAPSLECPLVGYDLDALALDAASRNAERAGLAPDAIRFEIGDARQAPPPAETGWLVTNPPYGERMAADEMGLWREWSQNLKQNFSGWQVNIISSDLDLPQQLRLKPKRRFPLYNGGLDCRLFNFEMVQASYRRVPAKPTE